MRGQTAIEFLSYASVFLLFGVITASIIFFVQNAETSMRESMVVKEVSVKFAEAINLVSGVGEGFNYTLKFESYVFERPYQLLINENGGSMYINWTSKNGETLYYPLSIRETQIFSSDLPLVGEYYVLDSTSGNKLLLSYNNDMINIEVAEE